MIPAAVMLLARSGSGDGGSGGADFALEVEPKERATHAKDDADDQGDELILVHDCFLFLHHDENARVCGYLHMEV